MGFCLFRHADLPNTFFAVNPAFVDGVEEVIDKKAGRRYALLQINHPAMKNVKFFRPVVDAPAEQLRAVLRQGAHLGVRQLKTVMIPKPTSKKTMPLLVAQPDRVFLVHEMDSDVYNEDTPFASGSIAYFDDGSVRILGLRPGVFAHQTNARHTVPMLI